MTTPDVPLVKPCRCPGRRIPVRLSSDVLARLVVSDLPDAQPVLTYRCRDCRTVVHLTLGDLRKNLAA